MIGTIRYMSPERLAGAGYGVAADVWSLGVVLLEMAARRLPFESAVSQIELHDRLEASKTNSVCVCVCVCVYFPLSLVVVLDCGYVRGTHVLGVLGVCMHACVLLFFLSRVVAVGTFELRPRWKGSYLTLECSCSPRSDRFACSNNHSRKKQARRRQRMHFFHAYHLLRSNLTPTFPGFLHPTQPPARPSGGRPRQAGSGALAALRGGSPRLPANQARRPPEPDGTPGARVVPKVPRAPDSCT